MMSTFLKNTYWLGLAVVLLAAGCSKEDDPDPVNEGEEFTTVEFTLTPTSGSPIVISYKDLDGEGGNAPVFSPSLLSLAANTTYTTKLRFINESVSPAEDITPEIETEESDEHEVYYVASSGLPVTVSGRNADKNGKPLGTTATLATAAAATSPGTLTITLKHKPATDYPAKTDNDPITKGETDVEVIFPAEVK
jgi:hypothetical protein